MKRIILLSLVLTFSLSAKALDNKAFCEAIEQGREAINLGYRGQTVKSERLQKESKKKLLNMFDNGVKLIPDYNLRVVKNRPGVSPDFELECFDFIHKNFIKIGKLWICTIEDKINCNKNTATKSSIFESLEEASLNLGKVTVIGTFVVVDSRLELKDSSHFDDFAISMKIERFERVDPIANN